MRRLRAHILIVPLMLAASACASAPVTTARTAELPATIVAFAAKPFWFGLSEHSPFGPIPYGLAAHTEGTALVLRGDVPEGMGLPPGAYQQFTFVADATGSHIDFETSLTGTVVKGRLIETRRGADDVDYCMPPERGGCAAMAVSFTAAPGGVRFVTRRGDAAHHAVVLRPAEQR